MQRLKALEVMGRRGAWPQLASYKRLLMIERKERAMQCINGWCDGTPRVLYKFPLLVMKYCPGLAALQLARAEVDGHSMLWILPPPPRSEGVIAWTSISFIGHESA